jgi:hypothetical protein
VLTLIDDLTVRFVHDEVTYEPLRGDAVLGALLFTLGVDKVDLANARHAHKTTLRLVFDTARQFAHVLERHAGRADRAQPLLPAKVSVADARGWFAQAAAAVPEAEQERFCWRVARRLGPDPWADGSAAIELRNQQFGLFEADFEEREEGAPAPAAAPAPEAEG